MSLTAKVFDTEICPHCYYSYITHIIWRMSGPIERNHILNVVVVVVVFFSIHIRTRLSFHICTRTHSRGTERCSLWVHIIIVWRMSHFPDCRKNDNKIKYDRTLRTSQCQVEGHDNVPNDSVHNIYRCIHYSTTERNRFSKFGVLSMYLRIWNVSAPRASGISSAIFSRIARVHSVYWPLL